MVSAPLTRALPSSAQFPHGSGASCPIAAALPTAPDDWAGTGAICLRAIRTGFCSAPTPDQRALARLRREHAFLPRLAGAASARAGAADRKRPRAASVPTEAGRLSLQNRAVAW